MSFKIQKKQKIPMVLRKRDNKIYIQCQYEVASKYNEKLGNFLDFYTIDVNIAAEEIGDKIITLINRFQSYGDMSLQDVKEIKKMPWEAYNKIRTEELYAFFGVKESVELVRRYQEVSIIYGVANEKYSIDFSYYDKRKRCIEIVASTGKENLLTFDTPLEFDATISPNALGGMILEAFDRCQQLADASEGKSYEVKKIELLDDSVLEVQAPRDKHFSDAEDMGVGEAYQVYEYYPGEDSDSAQALFYLGIGAELNCDLSEENIRAVWEKFYGTADYFECQELCYGIFSLRAELRNSKMHRISYFLPLEEALILECGMEVYHAGKRKKLDEKLTVLFEGFAGRCRRKQK